MRLNDVLPVSSNQYLFETGKTHPKLRSQLAIGHSAVKYPDLSNSFRVEFGLRPASFLNGVNGVIRSRSCKQMLGVDTFGSVAVVAHIKPRRNATVHDLEHHPMRQPFPSSLFDFPISLGSITPYPASSEFWTVRGNRAVLIHSRPKPSIPSVRVLLSHSAVGLDADFVSRHGANHTADRHEKSNKLGGQFA